jgi:hypothetical protein
MGASIGPIGRIVAVDREVCGSVALSEGGDPDGRHSLGRAAVSTES